MTRFTMNDFEATPKTRKEFIEKWNTDHIFKARAILTGFSVVGDNVIFPTGRVANKNTK